MTDKIAISVSEAAELLGISKPKMYEIIRREDFKAAFQVGTRTLISRSKLESWVEMQAGGMLL